jgi:hypothetical protein
VLPLVEIRHVENGEQADGVSSRSHAFASMRPVEVLALRWNDVLRDRYGRTCLRRRVPRSDDEFDKLKTGAGNREMPFGRNSITQCKLLKRMVGERGFEPPTPWSRTEEVA